MFSNNKKKWFFVSYGRSIKETQIAIKKQSKILESKRNFQQSYLLFFKRPGCRIKMRLSSKQTYTSDFYFF